MNRSTSIAWTRLTASAGLVVFLGACAVQSTPQNDGELQEALVSGRQFSHLAAAPSTCERDPNGVVTTSPDLCNGKGAPRVLVHLDAATTCDTVLALTSSSITVSRQFEGAPAVVSDHFCAFEAPAGDTAAVPALLSSLCAIPSVTQAVHDCSDAAADATDPNAAPEGHVTKAPMRVFALKLEDPGDAPAAGPHSCDTCGIVQSDMLYVNIPLSMVPADGDVMIVRSLDAEVPDRAIAPPPGAQSFVIPQIGLPDAAAVRVYAPGEVPPPKS